METISENKLRELLNSDDLWVVEICKGDNIYEIQKDVSIKFESNKKECVEIKGYILLLNEENGTTDIYKTKKIDMFIKYLKREGFIEKGNITLYSIDGEYNSVEEYEEHIKFNSLDMKGLLEKYAESDTFSLTAPYSAGVTEKYPDGIYKIDKKLSDEVFVETEKYYKEELKHIYDGIIENERKKLPEFEVLYSDIYNEATEFHNKYRMGKPNSNKFLCDRFSDENTKYTEPEEVWHFYEMLGALLDIKESLERMNKNVRERALDCELEWEKYLPLKPYLQEVKVSFHWHCTMSGELHKIFYIGLNDVTKKWLLKYKSDYDLTPLEDLAFYKNGQLMFSSCTHERFRNDFSVK